MKRIDIAKVREPISIERVCHDERFRHEPDIARPVQKLRTMASAHGTIRILLIRPWTKPLAPFRAAIRDGGFEARVVRVDIEPAINAALSRGEFHVVVFDPETPSITREIIEDRLRVHRRDASFVMFDGLDGLGDSAS